MKKETFSARFSLAYRFFVIALWVLALCPCLSGCGKKELPLPPHGDPVPPVTDLSHEIRGSRVVLEWTVPDKVKKGAFGEGEMILFRAKTKLTGELCPECPLVFQRIAVLPILQADSEPKPAYEEALQGGFRFTYKVELHMDSGRGSGPSNPVEFDYQDPGK